MANSLAAIVRPAVRGITVPRSDLDKGLVLEYLFFPVTGDRVLDSSGYGQHGTGQSTFTWSLTPYGVAGGQNNAQYHNVDAPVLNAYDNQWGEITVEVAIYADFDDQWNGAGVWFHGAPGAYPADRNTIVGYTNGQQWDFWVTCGSTPARVQSPARTLSDGLNHLVGVYDGSNVYLALNGVLGSGNAQSGNVRFSTGSYGQDLVSIFNGNGYAFPTLLSRVYNRALNQAEISWRYRQILGRAQEPRLTVWKAAYLLEGGLAGQRGHRGVLRGVARGV